ncbi:MAG TPA: Ppx/GppA phosphatase family protein [Candidatus Limnocylindria bacterium]|nr:Ppx/GppA phosphatase family protein [Candidatus Limnocylindria bacterium]
MSPRRSAFIDIGTNAILCLIVDIRDTGRFRVLDDLADIARLGQGVDRTGRISPEGEQRALEVLERYRDHCRNLGVEEVIAVGTSALRDAENSSEVRARYRDKLGFDIHVISGGDEAAYSFLAVQRGLSLGASEFMVFDVGGGSTEFIRGNQSGVAIAVSIDMGSVRLTERFLRGDPVRAVEVAPMIAAIDHEIAQLPRRGIQTDPGLTLVGIAGTFTTLAAVQKQLTRYSHSDVHGSCLSLDEVRRQVGLYQEKSVAERKKIVGMDAKRADVIFAGACLIERIMNFFHADRVIVSDQGVRYGLLYETAERRKSC